MEGPTQKNPMIRSSSERLAANQVDCGPRFSSLDFEKAAVVSQRQVSKTATGDDGK